MTSRRRTPHGRRAAAAAALLLGAALVAGCPAPPGTTPPTTSTTAPGPTSTTPSTSTSTTTSTTSTTVPAPTVTTLPGGGGYPRLIRLAHAGDRTGHLLVSVTRGSTQAVLESADEGASFRELSTIVPPGVLSIHGTGITELADGTLLVSMALRYSGDFATYDQRTFRMDGVVYRSTDGGRTWSRLSSCARTDLPGTYGGIWEPDLHIDASGALVCMWSDETAQPTYSQTILQVVSTDGGVSWGPPEPVVRLASPALRPGMPTTARLGDGTWIMSYEICGSPLDCAVHVRYSLDGRSWGAVTDAGQRVVTTSGHLPNAAPVISWTPAGGPSGTVLLTANWWPTIGSSVGNGTSVLMATNTARGRGGWTATTSPVAPGQSDACRHFSSPVVPLDASGRLIEVEVGLDAAGRCSTVVGTGRLP